MIIPHKMTAVLIQKFLLLLRQLSLEYFMRSNEGESQGRKFEGDSPQGGEMSRSDRGDGASANPFSKRVFRDALQFL